MTILKSVKIKNIKNLQKKLNIISNLIGANAT
jgi:hypothetical protein